MKPPGASCTHSLYAFFRPRFRAAFFLVSAALLFSGARLDASPDPVFIDWPSAITNAWQSGQVTYTNSTYPNGLAVSNINGAALVTIVSGTNGFSVNSNAGQSTVNGTNFLLLYFTPGTNSAINQPYTNTIQVALTNVTGAPPFGGATNNIDIVITPPPPNNPVFTGSFSNQWQTGPSIHPVAYTNLTGCRVSSPSSNSPTQFPVPDITNVTQVIVRFLSNSLGQTGNLTSLPLNASNNYFATSNGFGIVGPYTNVPSGLKPSNPWNSAANLETVASAPGWYDGTNAWVALNIVPGTNALPVTNYVQLLAFNGANSSTLNWTTNDLAILVEPVLTPPPALEVRFYNTSTNAASNVYIVPSSTDALGSYGNGFWWTNTSGSNNYTNWVDTSGNLSLRLSDLGVSGTNEIGRPYYSVFTTNFPNAAWYISYGGGHVTPAMWATNKPSPKTGALWYGHEWGPFEVTLDGNAADKSDMTYINQFSIPVAVRALTNDFANSLAANYPTNSSANLYQACGFTNWANSNAVAAGLSNLATQLLANFPNAAITNSSGNIVMYAGPSAAPAGALVAPQVPPYTNGATPNSFPLFTAYFDACRTSGAPAFIKDYIGLSGTNNGGTNTYNFYYELTNTVTSSNKLRLQGKLYVSNAPGSASFSATYSNLTMEIGADAGVNDNWASWTVYTAPTPANFVDKYQNYNLSGASNGLFTNVTAYSPAASNGLGGMAVSIVGTNLAGANMVFFAGPNDTLIPARHFTATNNTNITAYVPHGAVKGPIVVTRTNGGGGSGISDTNPANWFVATGATNTTAFTGPVISNASSPVITSFTPSSGAAAKPVFSATGDWLAAAIDTDTGPVNANPTTEDLFNSSFGANVMGRILGDMAAGFALGFINSSAPNLAYGGTNFGASPSGSWWGGNEFPAADTVNSNAYNDVNTNYSAWGKAIYASATKVTYGHPIYDRMQFYGAGNPASPLQIQPASGTNNVGPTGQLLPVWVVEVEFFNGLSSVGANPTPPSNVLNSLISNNATLPILTKGDYILTNDVVWSSTDTNVIAPIAVLTNDVGLNLNGFTIRATNSATSEGNLAGIIISDASTVAVTNGTIRGFRRNGISVVGATQILLGNLTIADIHNPTTNAPSFEEDLLNPTAGISIEGGLGVTVSNVVISNVSGGTNVMSVAGLDALLAPGLQVIGTTVTGVSNSIALGSPKNLCNGLSVLYSPDVVFSNITVSNVVGNSNTATANGLVTYTSANFQLLGSPAASNAISGITNYGGVAAGISGTQVSGMTVRNTRISDLFTGEDWTNNLIGHTVLGMVFAPLNGYPLGITNITVTNGGSGYTSAPKVTIGNVANDQGSGAKAVATVSNGSVVSMRVTATGSNFQTFPSIAFSGGGGSNAAAIALPFLPTPSFAPVNVLYDTNNTDTGGNVVVADCVVERVTGSIDDAHGISFFGVTNVVASNVVVRDVLDGTNTLGLGGSKATGIEVFGNPMVPDSKIKIVDCRVENIRAISPGDLAANGFSAAGGGITFINCTASNVSATSTIPGRQPAYGYGFGWAPDIRLNYQYPAWNVVHSNSTAIDCDYGFDTFNHRNASYLGSTNINNRITNFLVQPSTPGQVGGTVRIFHGAVWNQVYEATNYVKAVPVWNTAQNNNTNGLAPAVPLNAFIASNTTYTVRVPGSYNLTNGVLWGSTNISATAPLVLAGNNISLDLGGNTINGSAASFTDAGLVVGDGSAAYTGLVVSNGVIDGFSEYGVFVEGVQGAKFSALQILNTGGIITATSPLPSPLPAGFYAMLSPNLTLSNVLVSNVTSGVNSSLTAGVASFGCSNFTAIGGTIAGVRGVGVPVFQTNNAVFGFLATESPGAVCSNLSVSSISGFRYYKDITGIAMLGSSLSHVYTSTVTGVTNDGGTAQGINGSFGTVHMKVVDSRVSHIRTGQEWTNNPLGHTALGMVFTPSGRPVRSFITGITLTNSGSGYTSAPTVTLQTLSGDPGTNAAARAAVAGGRVTGARILNGGSDYIAAPKVVFSGGGGSNAAGLVMPHNVWPYTTYPCGDITVSNCVISNVVGGIDDAHGISFFAVTNVVADNVRIYNVLDGTNTMGPGGSNIGGSKATGIESYGNPAVVDANFQIRNSRVEDIHAISPGDLAAIGFSAAGGGINFYNCTALNVRVTGTNRLTSAASPGRGYGFAWAPDIRVVYQYPAWVATFVACTASFCDVGFDTFNFQDSIWYTPTSLSNRITDFLVEPSVPFFPEGTVRVLYGSYWNEVLDAPDYPGGIKGIPVWNNAINNARTYDSGLSGFANWAAQSGQILPAPGTPAYNNALFAYAFSGGSYQGSNSIPNAPVSTTMSNVTGGDYLVLTENIRTDDPSLVIWGESQTVLTNTGWNDADVSSTMSVNQSDAPAGTQFIDFLTPRGTAGKKFLRLKASYVQP